MSQGHHEALEARPGFRFYGVVEQDFDDRRVVRLFLEGREEPVLDFWGIDDSMEPQACVDAALQFYAKDGMDGSFEGLTHDFELSLALIEVQQEWRERKPEGERKWRFLPMPDQEPGRYDVILTDQPDPASS